MIVVSDTSPIGYLCQLGHVEILPVIFGQVVVPEAVVRELSHAAAPQPIRQFIEHAPAWLVVRTLNTIDSSLDELGAGERQAIALAHELPADLLIVDEKEARLEAEHRSIPVIGTLGVLKLAAERGLLELASATADLQKCGFYMSDALIHELLGEADNPPE